MKLVKRGDTGGAMPTKLRVQSAEGSAGYVDVSVDPRRCDCVAFLSQGTCAHLTLAIDVLNFDCKRSKYLFKSALHKELRRGDEPAALHWASWCDHGYGYPVALEYLRKIWSEETLNLDLAVRLHDPEIALPRAISLFCRSRKIWELPSVWFDLEATWSRPTRKRAKLVLAALEAAAAAHDFPALIRCFSATKEGSEPRRVFRQRLMDILEANGTLSTKLRAAIETRFASGRYEAEDYVLLLMAAGRIPAESSEYHPAPANRAPTGYLTDQTHLRLVPGYAYDYHTRAGRARLEKWRDENPDKDIRIGVDTGEVDLRWAGGLMTLFWRFEAFRQVGSNEAMDRLRWSDVAPTERWDRLLEWNDDWP